MPTQVRVELSSGPFELMAGNYAGIISAINARCPIPPPTPLVFHYGRDLEFEGSLGSCPRCHALQETSSVCPICCSRELVWCQSCNQEFPRGNCRVDSNNTYLCLPCQSQYYRCSRCNAWVLRVPLGEEHYCDSCQEAEDQEEADREEAERLHPIQRHDYKPEPIFHPTPSQTDLFLGVELETDNYPDLSESASDLTDLDPDQDLFYLKEDGSLSRGIEIVTHPATLDFHKTSFPWDKILQTVRQNEGKSHDTSTCGLHVHFNSNFFGPRDSKQHDLNALKLVYLFQKFWPQLVKFSRRDEYSLDIWAKRYKECHSLNQVQELPNIRSYKRGNAGRYYAINLGNHRTIEIRIFRGTLKYTTLIATLELVDFLAHYVTKTPIVALYRLTWPGLIKRAQALGYPYLVEYATNNVSEEDY